MLDCGDDWGHSRWGKESRIEAPIWCGRTFRVSNAEGEVWLGKVRKNTKSKLHHQVLENISQLLLSFTKSLLLHTKKPTKDINTSSPNISWGPVGGYLSPLGLKRGVLGQVTEWDWVHMESWYCSIYMIYIEITNVPSRLIIGLANPEKENSYPPLSCPSP